MTPANLTTDAVQGAYSVQVASASGFSVGQEVLLDEAGGESWSTDYFVGGSVKVWAGDRVMWMKHNPAQSALDDFTGISDYPANQRSTGCWFSSTSSPGRANDRCDRTTSEIKRIAAISGRTITFDSPITISYRVSHSAELSYYNYPFVSGAGVENISFSGADASTITMDSVINSWAYNIECYNSLGRNDIYNEASCVSIDELLRVQIERFYAHDNAFPDPAQGSYWFNVALGSSEVIIENGIMLNANKLTLSAEAGAGNVIAYNFMDDSEECAMADHWIENGANLSHYPNTHHNLLEGNLTHQLGDDNTHGNTIYNTYYRNWAQGYRMPAWINAYNGHTINDLINSPGASEGGSNGPLITAETQVYNYWDSFIGNVLGYSGYTTAVNGWQYSVGGGPSIWSLGWNANANHIDPKAGFDTNGQGGTTIAHGNYDYLQDTVTWDPNYSNHTLPISFYLSSAPSFFGPGASCAYPWPWVTPTGSSPIQTASGGTECSSRSGLPAKARYDAGTPFTQP